MLSEMKLKCIGSIPTGLCMLKRYVNIVIFRGSRTNKFSECLVFLVWEKRGLCSNPLLRIPRTFKHHSMFCQID